MSCEGPICKFCDERYHRRTVMKKEITTWIEGYEHMNTHVGWYCPNCLRSVDYCPQCSKLIGGIDGEDWDNEYKVIHDPDPQCVGYICSRCGYEEFY